MDMAWPKWTRPQPDWLYYSEEALPIRSEHCQNTEVFRSRHWKWSRLADDDLPPQPENKDQKAKTHETQVWPRKAERSQRVGNLPSYDRREVCTSHHHEQRRYNIDSMITTFNTAVTETASKIPGKHCQKKKPWITAEILDLCNKRERTEKEKIWALRIWDKQGSEQQHQEVHERG